MLIKNAIFRAVEATGLTSAFANSKWRRSRLLILCYHGVASRDEHEWNPGLYVSKMLLRQRLEYLRANCYAILPLAEALNCLAEGNLPHRAVTLTFDDGAKDFAECALPILKAYDAPATVYLTTYYCEHRYPVFNTALSYLMWRGRESGADLRVVCGAESPLPVADNAQRSRAWQVLQSVAKARCFDGHEKNAFLRTISNCLGIDFDAFVKSGLLQLMTREQIRSLPRELIDIQLHTHRHRTPREREAFEQEIHDNRSSIAVLSGEQSPRIHFCYPSGDYDGRFLSWLPDLGITSATTCVPGLANPTSNRLLLPRFIDTMMVTPETFAAWAAGCASLVPRRSGHTLDKNRLRIQGR